MTKKLSLRLRTIVTLVAMMSIMLAPNLMAMQQSGLALSSQFNADIEAVAQKLVSFNDDRARQGVVALTHHEQPAMAAAGKLMLDYYDDLRSKNPVIEERRDDAGTGAGFFGESGPSVAPEVSCYNGPPPCATWAEQNELAAYIDDELDEFDDLETELDEAVEEFEGGDPPPMAMSMPKTLTKSMMSALGLGGGGVMAQGAGECVDEIIQAGAAVVGGAAGTFGIGLALEGAAASGVTVTAAYVLTGWALVGGFAAVAAVAVGVAIYCMTQAPLPVADREGFTFGPMVANS